MKKIDRTLELDAVRSHRREDCLHYSNCLDEASALLWPSFSCEECERYRQVEVEKLSYEKAASPLAWEV